ncbi:cation-translocating P-type ATPase [Hymenobacter latericus]|uniref:cation-translocating P-type ATPase n=1 Tax=Hymenobacter sp. YIM 151858-1 TaxID=2987688 RepID=UPI0022260575|nr:cation-transporting P-type ATPase [Hymenobacter sp. YIM 151858-1]UYZ60702.1 cation-transporting P-type ATPase [Hymenobacter sp. YIM 151858-1]
MPAAYLSALSQQLGTDAHLGLTDAEARQRLLRHGPNAADNAPRESLWALAWRQLRSLAVLVLALAAGISFAMHDALEGYAILGVVGLNAAIGFWLELQARASVDALRRLDVVVAQVVRGGQLRTIAATELVPGDVLLLEAGDVVPADAQLIEANNLQVNESALTGESVPVTKNLREPAPNSPLGDQTHRVFKGTAVVDGNGRALVTGTGAQTEIGRIMGLVQQAERSATPLESKLNHLARQLIGVSVVLAAVYLVGGLLQGQPALRLFKTTVVLAVAAIPEGMSIVATLALAYGVLRLARRKVIVKQLTAVETLGGTNVIFTDKTGTLTRNELAVVLVCLPEGNIGFPRDAAPELASAHLGQVLRVVQLCNNAHYDAATGHEVGDPLEVALLKLVAQQGGRSEPVPRVAEQPFSADTRLMATVHQLGPHAFLTSVKGAPEAVLPLCTGLWQPAGPTPLSAADLGRWQTRAEELAQNGLRTLALACRTTPQPPHPPLAGQLSLLGLIAFLDPARAEVIPALQACREAGISVAMVTGDHPATALAIARQVHLGPAGNAAVVHGTELRPLPELSPAECQRLHAARVFARVSPAQKLDLVSLFQQRGDVVGMTGDGVNDAPALRKADIGVAMGQRGTRVAAEAASLVLQDDSFASIVAAVAQGRVIFDNIRQFLLYLVSSNLSEVLVVTAVGLLSLAEPLRPLQLLFLNMVTDVFLALALGLSAGHPNLMRRPPRKPGTPLLSAADWRLAGAFALIISACLLAAYLGLRQVASMDVVRTALFYGLALVQTLHIFNMGIGWQTLRNPYAWLALAASVGLLAATYLLPPVRAVMHIEALPPVGWAWVVGSAGAAMVLMQALKLLLHRLGAKHSTPTPPPETAARQPSESAPALVPVGATAPD